ncbi:MAG: polyprenyl synthetase family protein [Anaerolineae bacterium]
MRVYLEAIEAELTAALAPANLPLRDSPLFADFLNMLRYHLGWTDAQGNTVRADVGKRLRPLLVLLSCAAAQGEWQKALPAAAAIELVHNFSLIHDDIEDRSAERRGRAAVWKVWGLAQGTNAGDAMFVLARLALDRVQVEPSTWAEVHALFDRATLALTQGQFLDISFETREMVTVEEYIGMVKGKTAALLAASTEMGARIATCDRPGIQAFADYGENLGIAFQIVDDVLGIWGDPAVTGKPAGDDLWAKKKSFPVLAGAASDTSGEVQTFLRQPEVTLADVTHVLSIMERTGAREQTEAAAEGYLRRALEALDRTRLENPAMDELRGMAERAVKREK